MKVCVVAVGSIELDTLTQQADAPAGAWQPDEPVEGLPILRDANNISLIRSSVTLLWDAARQAFTFENVKLVTSSRSVTQACRGKIVVAVQVTGCPHLGIKPYIFAEEISVVTKDFVRPPHHPFLHNKAKLLTGIGNKAVDKLRNLHSALRSLALQENRTLPYLPPDLISITTVGGFLKLMQLCEDDDALGIMVQRLLKLTPEGWSSACQHASQAVEHKSYLLSWLAGDGRGLVFKCSPNLLPWFDMRSPVALLKDCSSDRELPTLIDDDVLLSAMQAEVSALCDSAQAAWEQPNHMLAGWSIFTLGAREISTLYEARHLIEDQVKSTSSGSATSGGGRKRRNAGHDSMPAEKSELSSPVGDDLRRFRQCRAASFPGALGGPWPPRDVLANADYEFAQASKMLLPRMSTEQPRLNLPFEEILQAQASQLSMSPFHLRDAMSVIGPPQQGTAAAVSRPYHGHMYLDRNSATGMPLCSLPGDTIADVELPYALIGDPWGHF